MQYHYLQTTLPRVGSLMGPIYDFLRGAFIPALFGGKEVSADLR